MGVTNTTKANGELKNSAALAKAIHWTDIQEQLKELTFKEFKEVIFPVIEHFQNLEA
tara:strand:+ start:3843 stop:4013 length:171 start_codon:yes stop_codon:yes gene_type:complete